MQVHVSPIYRGPIDSPRCGATTVNVTAAGNPGGAGHDPEVMMLVEPKPDRGVWTVYMTRDDAAALRDALTTALDVAYAGRSA